ncbi:MAG: glycosyltransferase, partial [Acidobacteria bacterium]|nr:glycosyltransferase [Acidobacteriota bacterium]
PDGGRRHLAPVRLADRRGLVPPRAAARARRPPRPAPAALRPHDVRRPRRPAPGRRPPRGPRHRVGTPRGHRQSPRAAIVAGAPHAHRRAVAGRGRRQPRRLRPHVPPRPLAAARGPLVATVHDMTLHRTPWAMREETRADLERKLERTIARARAVITPTETVRAELLERCGAPSGAVHAVHEAGRLDRVAPGEPPPDVPARFVLHVGTIEPRKNVATLLDAWPRLRAAMPDAPPLVLCGKLGWRRESIEDELARA